ncbi:hypothetical protein O9992_21655 [Vibrio lentus]|nr:hypothetical protein [Vibrio lentus]
MSANGGSTTLGRLRRRAPAHCGRFTSSPQWTTTRQVVAPISSFICPPCIRYWMWLEAGSPPSAMT